MAFLPVASSLPAAPVLGIMAIGVIVAMVGHAMRSRGTVVTGLTLVFLATAGMVLGGFAAYHSGESDPRPGCPGGDCRSAPDSPNGGGLR